MFITRAQIIQIDRFFYYLVQCVLCAVKSRMLEGMGGEPAQHNKVG